MNLYHFTQPESLDAILRDGLVASPGRVGNNDLINGQKVVWLTAKPSLEISLEEKKLLLKRGILCGPRYRSMPLSTVCLKMVIPTNDRRLKHFPTWMHKHPQPGVDPNDPLFDPQWWFYKGDIAPDRLSVFKTVPQGVTYWELTTVREAWRSGMEPVFPPDLEADLLAGRVGPDGYVEAHARPKMERKRRAA
jgi:hypothetical protein